MFKKMIPIPVKNARKTLDPLHSSIVTWERLDPPTSSIVTWERLDPPPSRIVTWERLDPSPAIIALVRLFVGIG